ncbi:MAG: 2'-5' RNA ligase family protein [Lewinellaceae bacterium]|nr:2'-5' RNA ligase family protein [Saprospiraceae bacterium]MCB9337523.1 2'-5' RNA ligase family protein [Lewinellaceae bacterium]
MERIRQAFNPAQFALIKSHVTLCREDELEDLERVIRNLKNLKHDCITIEFGDPIRFSEGKGVLLPAMGGLADFQKLRKKILHGLVENPRKPEPHITLLHPRNATCTDEIFSQIQQTDFPRRIEFCKISLIEQEVGEAWQVLEEFGLQG